MKAFKALLLVLIIIAGAVTALIKGDIFSDNEQAGQQEDYDKVINFPSDRYPETAKHIKDAIKEGYSSVCTIDRDGVHKRREQSLKDIPVKKGYDRDEWPMAVCKQGGTNASVEYISPADNRGAGSWVGHQLTNDPDGTRVLFKIK